MEKKIILKKIKNKYFTSKKNIYKEKYKETKEKYDFLYGIIDARHLKPARGKLREYQLQLTNYANNWFNKFEELGIQYFLISGNLLGAYRNGGFIPWDDDFDIGMMREDYEKLKNYLKQNYVEIPTRIMSYDLKNKYKIISQYINKYPGKILYMVDHFHIGIINGTNIEDYKLLEIFPYDYYKEDVSIEELKNIKNKIQSMINNKFNFGQIYDYVQEMIKQYTVQKSSKINFGFDSWDCTHILHENWFSEDDIFPLKKIKFENFEFYAPNNIYKSLEVNYGKNYMDMPANFKISDHVSYRTSCENIKVRSLNKRIVTSRFKHKYFKNEEADYKYYYKKYKALQDFILDIIDINNVNPTKNKRLRDYQLKLVSFANKIANFLDKNGLEYFLSSGNLIGAIRHGGFVPWDDDIDFGMMRKDYEKLKKILYENYKAIDVSKVIPAKYNKDIIVDKALRESNGKIIFFDGPRYIQIMQGTCLKDSVLVDIFSHEYYKDDYTKEEHKKYVSEILSQTKKLDSCKDKRDYLQKAIKSNPNVQENSNTIYYGIDNLGSYIVNPTSLMKKTTIFPRCKVKFEGYEFYAPNNPEEYIKVQYPNFMEIPENFSIAPDLKDKLRELNF